LGADGYQAFTNGDPFWVHLRRDYLWPLVPYTNYAYGGSGVDSELLPQTSVSGSRFGQTLFSVPGLRQQVDGFLVETSSMPAGTLILISSGANDYLDLSGALQTEEDVVARVAFVVSTIVAQVARILALPRDGNGLLYILVGKMIPVEDLPLAAILPAEFQAFLPLLAPAHNAALQAGLESLALDDYQYVGMAGGSIYFDMKADPAAYGVDNFDRCSDPVTFEPCVTPETYFFWDYYHPTNTGHRIFAQGIYEYNFSAGAALLPATALATVVAFLAALGGMQ